LRRKGRDASRGSLRSFTRAKAALIQDDNMKATVFLGGGRITGALAAGLRLAEAGQKVTGRKQVGHKKAARRIIVYDRHPEKLRALRRESRIEIARDLKSAIAQADMLIVAVRPGSVKEMLSEVTACGATPPKLCVSLAAGVPLRSLQTWLGQPTRWVRAMPSPVCRIGRGFTSVCFSDGVTKSERTRVRKFFEQVGLVLELPERQMDTITATYSSTHGYHVLATLAKAAQDAGLDRKTALLAASHALSEGIFYWRQSGQSLDDLLEEAATPGGIAAATMAAMDKSGYTRAVANGLKAGIAQARRNAKS
jgi:pyrroline-5-carboxylate reductase